MHNFDEAIEVIKKATVLVVDVESNGLKVYGDTQVIGVAVYAPEVDQAFYFPFRHGVGKIEVELDDPTKGFHELRWSDHGKKELYLRYWYERTPLDYGNLNADQERTLQAVLFKDKRIIFHNAIFDLAALRMAGYGTPEMIEDTLIGLHLVNEDMGGVYLEAPFKWSDTDRLTGRCKPEQVGEWAIAANGKPLLKRQPANKELKWFSAYIGLEGAMDGETGLSREMRNLEESIVDTVMANALDPMNVSLLYKTYETGKDRGPERTAAQRERFKTKINLKDKSQMWMLPAPAVAPYAIQDVKLTWGLRNWIMGVLADWDNVDLYHSECEVLLKVLHPMEAKGIRLDVKEARAQQGFLEERAKSLSWLMHDWVGDFNPASPSQLLTVLNSGVLKRKDGPIPDWWDDETRATLGTYSHWSIGSTNAETLENYKHHPFVMMLLEYRKASKGGATYLTNWLKNYDGQFMIHPKFNITGTVSGRLSSSGDAGNFQNIPDRNGFTLKKALVVPDTRHMIVNIDYGQLELRLAAWIAEVELGLDQGELRMTTMFESGEDMHAYTRDQVNIRDIVWPKMGDKEIVQALGYDLHKIEDAPAKIVQKQARFIAKTMNFGLLYNGGKRMLAKLLRLDEETADVLVQKWRQLYPAFPRANSYYEQLASKWRWLPGNDRRKGLYVTQPFSGRHRKFDKYDERVVVVDDNGMKQVWNERETQQRKVFNNVVQGTGGDVAKQSALRIVRRFPQVWLYAIIHDSLDFFLPIADQDIIPEIVDIMIDWDVRPKLTVDVEVSIGNWQDMIKGIHYDHTRREWYTEDEDKTRTWYKLPLEAADGKGRD